LIHTLPKRDRAYFQSIVRFIIGKDVALANLQPHQMYAMQECAKNILLFISYIKLGGNMLEYINRRVAEYQNILKTTMADRALFLKYWTGSIQSVTQRLVSEYASTPETGRRMLPSRREEEYVR